MTTLTKSLMLTATLLAAVSTAQAKTGKCISPDGNVYDCVITEPAHVAKAKRILRGGSAGGDGRGTATASAPSTPGGGGSGPVTGTIDPGIDIGGIDRGGPDLGDIGGIDLDL